MKLWWVIIALPPQNISENIRYFKASDPNESGKGKDKGKETSPDDLVDDPLGSTFCMSFLPFRCLCVIVIVVACSAGT
jgi:hypothetical protein